MRRILIIAPVALMLLAFTNGAHAQVWYHHRVYEDSPIFSSYQSNAPAYTFNYTPGSGLYQRVPSVPSYYMNTPWATGTYYNPSTSLNPSTYGYSYGGYYYPAFPSPYYGR